MRRLLKDYGLSITLAALFLASWLGQFIAQGVEHGNKKGFWPAFWQATLENWQSEFLQLFAMVVLTALLLHRGSAESRDSNDRLEQKIDAIYEKITGRDDVGRK